MRGNQAYNLPVEDQPNRKPMEPRIARIESDVGHINKALEGIQLDVRELRSGLSAANESIVEVKTTVAALDRKLDDQISALDRKLDDKFSALDGKFDGRITALEKKMDDKLSAMDEKLVARIQASSSALESKLIKWMVGTAIAVVGTVIASLGVALAIAQVMFGSKLP